MGGKVSHLEAVFDASVTGYGKRYSAPNPSTG